MMRYRFKIQSQASPKLNKNVSMISSIEGLQALGWFGEIEKESLEDGWIECFFHDCVTGQIRLMINTIGSGCGNCHYSSSPHILEQMIRLSLLVFCVILSLQLLVFAQNKSNSKLREIPIMGSSPLYLESWTLRASIPKQSFSTPSSNLQYYKNVDMPTIINSTSTSIPIDAIKIAPSLEACCLLCYNSDYCYGASYVQSTYACLFKNKDKTYNNQKVNSSHTDSCIINKKEDFLTININASVPGDIITNLYQASIIPHPLYELNFKNSSIYADNTWTYETYFDISNNSSEDKNYYLIFDGIKMKSRIFINDYILSVSSSQFLQYVIPLSSSLLHKSASNKVTVIFDPQWISDVNGRFSACSGGWDWAPYSVDRVVDPRSITGGLIKLGSYGLVKSVYIVTDISEIESNPLHLLLHHISPHSYYQGSYTNKIIEDGNHSGFRVVTDIIVSSTVQYTQPIEIIMTNSWNQNQVSKSLQLPGSATQYKVTMETTAMASDVKLWWPSGFGDMRKQNLYYINVLIKLANNSVSVGAIRDRRRIGFKVFNIVTVDDRNITSVSLTSNPPLIGMMFRINGQAMFARGANFIPLSIQESTVDAKTIYYHLKSAVDANMNIIRIWGGGEYLSSFFYDLCDELGILIYHDMQYAQKGHSPLKNNVNKNEIVYQVRRVSHHVSIALWDGCNECVVIKHTSTDVYLWMLQLLVEEDDSRPIWPSCPSKGWASGVDVLTGLPNHSDLIPTDASSSILIERHGPYNHGNGWPAVNLRNSLPCNIPLSLVQTSTGPGQPNIFTSEFGASGMSSFESLSVSLSPEHYSLHGGSPSLKNCTIRHADDEYTCLGNNVMGHRNYPCDSFLSAFFNTSIPINLDEVGVRPFQKQLWMCMISQALWMKYEILLQRSLNTFGSMVWQLGEIWPTGGWGSLEYGVPSFPGQVVGGRWKPIHYWYMTTIYTSIIAACDPKIMLCFIKNDQIEPLKGYVGIRSVMLDTGASTTLFSQSISMVAGPGITTWFNFENNTPANFTNSILILSVLSSDSISVIYENPMLLSSPASLTGLQPSNIKVSISSNISSVCNDGDIKLVITSTAPISLFVTLTTQAHGRFNNNAFIMEGYINESICFIPYYDMYANIDDVLLELETTLRIEDLAHYLL